jgi:hypothetical protein
MTFIRSLKIKFAAVMQLMEKGGRVFQLCRLLLMSAHQGEVT